MASTHPPRGCDGSGPTRRIPIPSAGAPAAIRRIRGHLPRKADAAGPHLRHPPSACVDAACERERACQAVSPARGRAAVSGWDGAGGFRATARAGPTANSAEAPAPRGNVNTSSPISQMVAPGPIAATVPETCQPRMNGGAVPNAPLVRCIASAGFTPAADTAVTSPSGSYGFSPIDEARPPLMCVDAMDVRRHAASTLHDTACRPRAIASVNTDTTRKRRMPRFRPVREGTAASEPHARITWRRPPAG